jgi:hypothetical protein
MGEVLEVSTGTPAARLSSTTPGEHSEREAYITTSMRPSSSEKSEGERRPWMTMGAGHALRKEAGGGSMRCSVTLGCVHAATTCVTMFFEAPRPGMSTLSTRCMEAAASKATAAAAAAAGGVPLRCAARAVAAGGGKFCSS